MSNNTDENLTFSTSQKVFYSSKRKSTQIVRVDQLLYVRDDGTVFEVGSNWLFPKYRQIVESNNVPEYETCKECGQVHDELEHRTYNNTVSPFSVGQKVIAALSKGNNTT